MTDQIAEPSAADAIALLEVMLEGSPIRLNPAARPIAFDLISGIWTFDPKPNGALCVEGEVNAPKLKIRCEPPVFVRLLTAPEFHLEEGEELSVEGDPNLLTPVINALSAGQGLLAVRSEQISRSRKTRPR